MSFPRMTLRVLLAFALAAVFLPTARPAAALAPATFVATTAAWAQAEEREYGVPASVAMAQAILESGWGESSLTKNAKNWFGIKCSSTASKWQTGCLAVSTKEYDSAGNLYTTTAQFRKYATDQNSFIDHGLFLKSPARYAKAFKYTNNPDRFIVEVHLGGYATDPQYANKVIDLMVKYNLYQYNVTPPSAAASELTIRPQTQAQVGAAAHVTGLLSPGGAGTEVLTQVSTSKGWITDQKVTTRSRGHFSIPLTSGANSAGSTKYRVMTASGTLASPEFTIERLGSISVTPIAAVLVGATSHLTGSAAGYAGRAITSQVLVNGTWLNHTTATVQGNGTFDLPLTYGQTVAGTRSYRARLVTASGATLTSSQVTAQWSASPTTPPTTPPTTTPPVVPPTPSVRLVNKAQIGQGWTAAQTIFPGDWDQNGHEDLMLRTPTGDLYYYRATSTGRFSAPVKIGNGWSPAVDIMGGQDWSGDGRPDLMARFADGRLVLYPGNGSGGFAAPRQVGHGWQSFTSLTSIAKSVGGKPAVVGTLRSGEVLLYSSNGTGVLNSPLRLASDWSKLQTLTGVGDWNRNGRSDLVAIEASGKLQLIAVGSNAVTSANTEIGTGWGPMRRLGGITASNGTQFLWAVATNGGLYSYQVAN
ncbi:glucosaminidase domain-containing protein [Tessaracoccus sp.]